MVLPRQTIEPLYHSINDLVLCYYLFVDYVNYIFPIGILYHTRGILYNLL